MSFRRIVTVAVACVVAPASASAQRIPSPYRFVDTRQELGVFVGTSSVSTGRFGYGPSGGVSAGARWGIDLSGPMGLEVVGGVISGTRDVMNPAVVVGDARIGEADVLAGTADVRLRFTLTGDRTWYRMAPFALAGGGVVVGLSGSDPLDQELAADDRFSFGTSFFGTLGGGVRMSLTSRLALRGDAVFSLWKIRTPSGYSNPARNFANVERGEWTGGRHLTLSMVYRY